MSLSGKRHRVRLLAAFLWGAASLMLVEVLVLGAASWPPAEAIAGDAAPTRDGETTRRPDRAAAPTTTAGPRTTTSPTTSSTPAPSTTTARPPPPSTAPASTTQQAQPAGARQPGTIHLPEGGTATLVRKEVGPNAVLPVPNDLDKATWWGAGLGAEHGASVFAGHVNWGGRKGPFAELWHIELRDVITVVDESGKVWRYSVSRILTLDKNELAELAPELFGQDGKHRIVLVTCGGRWVGGAIGYAQNRVVVAVPIE